MDTNIKNKNKLTVGITTCYGEWSLVETARSIRNSKGVSDFRFIIVADRTPISKEIKAELDKLKVELFWNDVEGSQPKKLRQIVELADSEVLVTTQDDIKFDEFALKNILETFEKDKSITILGSRILPLKPETMVEASLGSMVRIVDSIAGEWNDRQNHLSASGRCLSFRTAFAKKFNFKDDVITADMFIFLENRRLGGKFVRPDNVVVYIRCPQTLREQVGPSARYQNSENELSNIYGDIRKFYKIPTHLAIKSVAKEFIFHPIAFIGYVFIYIYTRINTENKSKHLTTVWEVDKTTKS